MEEEEKANEGGVKLEVETGARGARTPAFRATGARVLARRMPSS